MPEMSSEVQAAFEAAQKQEHIVDYLSDSVKFTLQMHRYLYYISLIDYADTPTWTVPPGHPHLDIPTWTSRPI